MVKIYDGEVFTLDINSYNRMQTLMECWKFTHCENMHFIIYDNENIIGAMSYYDIVMNREFRSKCLTMGKNMFAEARDWFIGINADEHACLPVLNTAGELLFIAEYYHNKIFNISESGIIYDEFSEYDFDRTKATLDYTLFEGKDAAVFWEVEEYTYAITELLLEVFPDMMIIYLDKNAELFWNNDNVIIKKSIYDIEKYICNKNCIYIHSKRIDNNTMVPGTILNIYKSLSVMTSLLWTVKRHYNVGINSDKTILLIDCICGIAGLVDIMRFCCIYVRIARKRGWIPVIKLDSFPNQYLECEGENMWEYYFEPVSDILENDMLKNGSIISLKENHNWLNMYEINPFFLHEDSYLHSVTKEKYFKNEIVLNQITRKYVEENMPEQIKNESIKVLGVVMRGSDYRNSAIKKRGEKKENAEPQQVIKRINEICALWGYEYIFVATEDNEYLEMFKNEFKERLIYVSQKRVHYVTQIDDDKFVNQMLNIQGDKDFTRKYLTTLTALSKCDALLASTYCGAVFAARSWKDGEYEVDEIMYY